MRRSWSEAEGRAAIEAWRSSGETLKAYSVRVGVGESKLQYWRARLNAGAAAKPGSAKARVGSATGAATFLPVVLRKEEALAAAAISGARRRDEHESATRGLVEPEWAARFVRALFGSEGSR